eukprot:TRINITY_DN18715_c0_g1_i1.p1 TRINITY_DN18715_c0_g1~~TRINITY_DN18715_c0_g1_i1.p1  ORF type:complete len:525 (+),score=191.93 TRINITY_DN18715_c0_g1_i1:190-1764(+)
MGMTTRDKFRLGLMWGMSLTQQDLDKYSLYFLLAGTSYGCNFLDAYSWFFFVSAICILFFQPLCGWLTDYTSANQHRTMVASSVLQLVTFIAELIICRAWIPLPVLLAEPGVGDEKRGSQVYILIVCWMVRWFAITQSQTSCWKLIKLRLERVFLEHGKDTKALAEMNEVVSRIGNIGDISSDLYEMVLLGSTILLPRVASHWYTDEVMRFSVLGATLLANVLVVAFAMTFTKDQIALPKQIALPAKQRDSPQPTGDDLEVVPLRSDDKAATASLAQSHMSSGELTPLLPSRTPRSVRLIVLDYIRVRARYFWRSKLVMHPLNMCLVVTIFYNLVEYPLTLNESVIMSTSNSSDEVCSGVLRSLMNQGGVLNITFMAGSFGYLLFLVRLRPYVYFLWIYPLLSVLVCACMAVLWLPSLPDLATYVIVSVAQVLPYYMSMYLFFVFTASADPEFYGFVYSTYGLGAQLISFIPAIVLLIPQVTNNVIIIVCLVLVVLNLLYSVYFSLTYRKGLQDAVMKEVAEFD